MKIAVAASAVWLIAFGIGAHRAFFALLKDYRTLKHTETLRRELERETQQIMNASLDIRDKSRSAEFLQGLVTLLPHSKGFIRTQRAMSDEVEGLRYKVGRVIKNDLHVLVDTRANRLYVKKGLTLLWDADCSVGKGGVL